MNTVISDSVLSEKHYKVGETTRAQRTIGNEWESNFVQRENTNLYHLPLPARLAPTRKGRSAMSSPKGNLIYYDQVLSACVRANAIRVVYNVHKAIRTNCLPFGEAYHEIHTRSLKQSIVLLHFL